MPSFAIPANYKYADPHLVALLADTETDLPVVTPTGPVVAPAKIWVQCPTSNNGNVFIGPTGILMDYTKTIFELAPGDGMYLPNHLIAYWKLRSVLANQMLVTYFEGVF